LEKFANFAISQIWEIFIIYIYKTLEAGVHGKEFFFLGLVNTNALKPQSTILALPCVSFNNHVMEAK
jgi:hypothetical protein